MPSKLFQIVRNALASFSENQNSQQNWTFMTWHTIALCLLAKVYQLKISMLFHFDGVQSVLSITYICGYIRDRIKKKSGYPRFTRETDRRTHQNCVLYVLCTMYTYDPQCDELIGDDF